LYKHVTTFFHFALCGTKPHIPFVKLPLVNLILLTKIICDIWK